MTAHQPPAGVNPDPGFFGSRPFPSFTCLDCGREVVRWQEWHEPCPGGMNAEDGGELDAAREVLARARSHAHTCWLFNGGFKMETYVAIVDMLQVLETNERASVRVREEAKNVVDWCDTHRRDTPPELAGIIRRLTQLIEATE